jgi:hypothetical protein
MDAGQNGGEAEGRRIQYTGTEAEQTEGEEQNTN